MVRIKSITDVITNSSTEVFSLVSRKSVSDLKRMIDLLLEAGGSKKRCDDLFNITLTIPYEKHAKEYYHGTQDWEELSEDEKIDFCLGEANIYDDDAIYLFPEVTITPKSKDIPDELVDFLKASVDKGLTPVDATFC